MIKSEVKSIAPSDAAAMLQFNTINRPFSKITAESYAFAMGRGEWAVNGEAIIFDGSGNLLNGQHRLNAVIIHGKPVEMLVVTGVNTDAFATMDRPRTRTAADVLSIGGEKNTRTLSAAARAYIHCTEGRTRANQQVTPLMVQALIDAHPELRYWTQRMHSNSKSKMMPSMLAGIITIASEMYGVAKLDIFFDRLVDGIGLSEKDPAYVLRERLLNRGTTSLTEQAKMAFIIKAINAHIKGKKISFLRHLATEEMPSIE